MAVAPLPVACLQLARCLAGWVGIRCGSLGVAPLPVLVVDKLCE